MRVKVDSVSSGKALGSGRVSTNQEPPRQRCMAKRPLAPISTSTTSWP